MDKVNEQLIQVLERLIREALARPNRPVKGEGEDGWLDPHANEGRSRIDGLHIGLHRYAVHADCGLQAVQELIDGIKAGGELGAVPGPRGATKLGLNGKPIKNLQIYAE